MIRKLLLITGMFCAGIGAAQADTYKLENRTLKPRVDLTARTGTENRRIGTIGAWVPLSQNDNEVLYSDFRFTRQNSDDDEGNFGIGYRSMNIVPGAVVGMHGWYDNRHTNRGTIVHQATVGAEYMSDKFEARVNAYAPIAARTKRWITPNVGHIGPYLAGNGIYIDTIGIIIEEPQPGFDMEFGAPFTPAEKYMDSLRLYGGVYSFYGRDTPDVSGVRVRAVADINPWVQVGARLQDDGPRGAQAYLEATFRLPVSAKLMKKHDGLRSHLDESPVRDIDIVTGSVVDTGGMKPVLNIETGTTQNVVWVDNTAAADGTGTKEKPFNTLKAAEAVLKDHDILYISRGDGTTTGQNAGLVVAPNDVTVIGSGVDFVYDSGRFMPSSGVATNGTVLRAATGNPFITNTVGNGVTVTGADSYLTGFTVDSTSSRGISVQYDGVSGGALRIASVTTQNNSISGIVTELTNNAHLDSINIENITSSGNGERGIFIDNRGTIGAITLNANNASNNIAAGGRGIEIYSNGTGNGITSTTLANNTTSGNAIQGLWIFGDTNTSMGAVSVTGSTANNNGGVGIYIQADTGATLTSALVNTSTANANNTRGIYMDFDGATVGTATISNSTASNATGVNARGITIESSGASGLVSTALMSNNITNDNVSYGQFMNATNSGHITTATVTNATISSGIFAGIYGLAQLGGVIDTLLIQNSTASNMTTGNGRGIQVAADGAGSAINTVTLNGNTTNGNASYSTYTTASNNGLINTLNFTNGSATGNTVTAFYTLAQTGGDINTLNFNGTIASGNAAVGIRVEANGAGSTITNLNMTNTTTSNNGDAGLYLLSQVSGLISNVTLTGATSNTNTDRNTYIRALNDGKMGTVSVSSSTFNGATGSGRGLNIEASGTVASTITNVTLNNNTTNNNAVYGHYVTAATNAVITSATITNAIANSNGTNGLYIFSQTDGDIGTATISNSSATSNTGVGMRIEANGTGSTLGTVLYSGNTTLTNGTVGQSLVSQNAGNITTATITGSTNTNNTGRGILANITTDGDVGTLNITNNTSTGSLGTQGHGIQVLVSSAGSTLNNNTISGNTTTGNAQRGIYVAAQTDGDIIGTVSISGNTANTNTSRGIGIETNGTGSVINTVNISDNTANNNTLQGIYIQGVTDGVLTASMLTHNTVTGNASNGVFIDDDTVNAFNVDMGGGAFGGTGQNRIFSNTGTEIRVDLDGGQLKAENNWWGVGTGLAGGETTLDAASTIDAAPFLAADPGP